jgi:hypothetical protein
MAEMLQIGRPPITTPLNDPSTDQKDPDTGQISLWFFNRIWQRWLLDIHQRVNSNADTGGVSYGTDAQRLAPNNVPSNYPDGQLWFSTDTAIMWQNQLVGPPSKPVATWVKLGKFS